MVKTKAKCVVDGGLGVALEVKLPTGRKAWVRPDGELWQKSRCLGAEAFVPISDEHRRVDFGLAPEEVVELACNLQVMPDVKWRLPAAVLDRWAHKLVAMFKTESLVIYGYNEKKDDWLAVTPEQEVTGGSVDVDDCGPAFEVLMGLGYRVVGTIHTHPGGMVAGSSTDHGDLWTDCSGVHYVVARTTGGVGVYFSVPGAVWKIDDDKAWKREALWDSGTKVKSKKKVRGLVNHLGGRKLKKSVTTKKIMQLYQGGVGNSKWGTDWWKDDELAYWQGEAKEREYQSMLFPDEGGGVHGVPHRRQPKELEQLTMDEATAALVADKTYGEVRERALSQLLPEYCCGDDGYSLEGMMNEFENQLFGTGVGTFLEEGIPENRKLIRRYGWSLIKKFRMMLAYKDELRAAALVPKDTMGDGDRTIEEEEMPIELWFLRAELLTWLDDFDCEFMIQDDSVDGVKKGVNNGNTD